MVANVADAKSIFLQAVENVEPERWPAYLDDACGNDSGLRARVEALLSAYLQPNRMLDDNGAPPTLDQSSITERPGAVLGPYKLLEQIGEGGFGVVFSAEQDRPVRRKVALKVIKPGMDTRQVIARFEAERQALAMMDHPNIAKVFDAGTTGEKGDRNLLPERPEGSFAQKVPVPFFEGRPYFVMELVQGVPITEYCDQCNLSTNERLELFITACQAIQHAHQKGVIHRDIKPTNVLVAGGLAPFAPGTIAAMVAEQKVPVPLSSEKPLVKIIDFGVAKAIGQQLTEHTLMTAFAQMVGTPLYMSPEQAELSPLGVDTRSDIYSLGVLLYELLTGATPFDKDRLHSASYDELRRIIREEEPPRPSARISTLAADQSATIAEHRRTDTRHLSQQVRGELDWIVMKCLEKDRNRRYETPNSLARDIERYLQDEPVQACPPSASYRLKKFVRRNKVTLAFVALLAAGVAFLAYSNIAIKREREAKTMATARARAVSDLFQVMLSSPARGGRIMGSQYTVRELLDDYSASLGNQLAEQPEAEAEIRGTIGRTYFHLGLPDRAEPHLMRQIELRRNVDGPQHENVADSLVDYGWNLFAQQRYPEVEAPMREALEIYRQQGIRGSKPIDALAVLQQAFAWSDRHDEAAHVIEEAWQAMQGYDELPSHFRIEPDYDVTCHCASFAYYFATIGRQEQAADFHRKATLAAKRLRNPTQAANAFAALAVLRLRLGDQAGFREACGEMFAQLPSRVADDDINLMRIRVPCLGPDPLEDPNVLVREAEEFAAHNSLRTPYLNHTVLGAAHFRAGHYEQAARHLEEAVAQFPRDAPPSHGRDIMPELLLAMTKWQLGKHDDARRMLHELQPRIDERLQSPSIYWDRPAVLEIRRREAEAMIKPQELDEAVETKSRTTDDPKQ